MCLQSFSTKMRIYLKAFEHSNTDVTRADRDDDPITKDTCLLRTQTHHVERGKKIRKKVMYTYLKTAKREKTVQTYCVTLACRGGWESVTDASSLQCSKMKNKRLDEVETGIYSIAIKKERNFRMEYFFYYYY